MIIVAIGGMMNSGDDTFDAEGTGEFGVEGHRCGLRCGVNLIRQEEESRSQGKDDLR
jgi:hypothetical protein